MSENQFGVEYDVTKKSRLLKFYENYKILIFSILFILLISVGSVSFYVENSERKKNLLSENYLQSKIYLQAGINDKAIGILKEIIYDNDTTYSPLSFFLILDQNLITDYKEILVLFNHLIENNKFSNEMKNLMIYKKAVFSSNYINESEFIELTRPLINKETIWKPQTLLLIGDYFVSKKENIKAIEFYQKIFTIKNLNQDIYNHAKLQLSLITNE